MQLEGIHHITAITGDAPANVDFYARALGLRLVKKTVNFDSPDVYHLYYGDEHGSPGSILTFFEFPWSSCDDAEQDAWRARVTQAGARPTRIIDRQYFHSVYFREPGGVLFELATRGPGFAGDEPADHLGESLRLPAQHEHLRERLERTLTPLPSPRAPAPAS